MAETLENFDIADIIEEAISLSGGQSGTGSDVLSARRSLHLLMNRWSARSMNTWRIEHKVFEVAKGPRLVLPTAVDDVFTVLVELAKGTESPMRRIAADQYANLNRLYDGG